MQKAGKILLILSIVFSAWHAYAQFDTEVYDSLDNKILYNRQKSYGVIAHNLGLGVQFRTGKRLSIFKTRMLEFEFVTMKSYKQIKMLNPYPSNARRFVYGKLNEGFFLRANMVWKKLLNRKPYWGGVEVRWIYGGGVSLGIAKPYYLYVVYSVTTPDGYEDYQILTEQYDKNQQSWDMIYGRAPFTRGLNEITVHPGIHLKTGLNFEFGKNMTRIKALEIGGALDIIPFGMTIMAESGENQMVFPTLFLNFSLGKRYNKY